ncbi:hypothetical protein ACP6L2_01205 [Sphingobacterium lactis]|uniref:hypothetical protein n=1 Tax=Sphingobacterium lactis TaxID=797291 RepID=UPI003F7FCE54
MKPYFLIIIIIALLSSCRVHTTESYYTVTITEDANVYIKNNLNSTQIESVKSGEPIYMILDKSSKGFRKVKYKGKVGYIYRPSFKSYTRLDYKQTLSTASSQDSLKRDSEVKYKPASSSSGTVHVKGYYRKNGTYVRPHTRSSPRKK